MIDFVGIVHQVDCLYGSSFFRLSVIFHDQADVPDDDDALLCAGYSLRRVGDEDSLSKGLFGRDFGGVKFESAFGVLPEPEKDSGFSSGGKLSFVVIELDEFLHAVDFLIHLGRDVTRIFFLPFPESDNLLSGRGCFAEGNNEGAILIDIEGKDTIRMWIEDGFFGGAGINIPDNKHGIFAGISGDDDITFFVVGGGGDLIALGIGKRVHVLGVVVVDYFSSRR